MIDWLQNQMKFVSSVEEIGKVIGINIKLVPKNSTTDISRLYIYCVLY